MNTLASIAQNGFGCLPILATVRSGFRNHARPFLSSLYWRHIAECINPKLALMSKKKESGTMDDSEWRDSFPPPAACSIFPAFLICVWNNTLEILEWMLIKLTSRWIIFDRVTLAIRDVNSSLLITRSATLWDTAFAAQRQKVGQWKHIGFRWKRKQSKRCWFSRFGNAFPCHFCPERDLIADVAKIVIISFGISLKLQCTNQCSPELVCCARWCPWIRGTDHGLKLWCRARNLVSPHR